jgi:hypothetical protein
VADGGVMDGVRAQQPGGRWEKRGEQGSTLIQAGAPGFSL